MSEPDHEIYSNNVLRLVAFEVRFPEVEDLHRTAGLFNKALRDILPVPGPVPQEVTLEMQPGRPPATTHRDVGSRRLDRERRTSALITPMNLVVEVTTYEQYEVFRELIEAVLQRTQESISIPGITRIGLRYIDEIEAIELPEGEDWNHFIAPQLLGPVYGFAEQPVETLSQVLFPPKDGTRLACRFGTSQSPAVDRNGPLKIDGSSGGDRFVIDVDSSWSPSDETVPEFAPDEIMETVDRLHKPIGKFFEASITEQLRVEVLRRENEL